MKRTPALVVFEAEVPIGPLHYDHIAVSPDGHFRSLGKARVSAAPRRIAFVSPSRP